MIERSEREKGERERGEKRVRERESALARAQEGGREESERAKERVDRQRARELIKEGKAGGRVPNEKSLGQGVAG